MEIRDWPTREMIRSMAEQFPEFDVPSVETCLRMLRLHTDVLAAFEAHFTRHGLSRGRFFVMMLLFRDPKKGLRPAELAEKAGVTRATMTGLLDGLERACLIRRDPNTKDRRTLSVRLTAKGKQYMHRMLPEHFRRISGLMSSLSIKEKESLLLLLGKVDAGIPAVRDP